MRADGGECDLRRLLHHVAELAGEHELLAARDARRLDEEHVAADAGDREPGRDTRARPSAPPPRGRTSADRGRRGRRRRRPATGASAVPDAIRVAVLRSTFPSSRSSWRTPASRVYSEMTVSSTSSATVTSSSRSPFRSRCRGQRYPRRDRDLLVGRVAVEADDLHAVEQRPGDRLGLVRRRDEDHLGEVDLDVEVVVAERRVLSRVEHLEQGRRRVAAPVGADLVDLVEQDHRVHRLRVAERAHEPAREGADVRAPVAADLRLVADAAERHPHELAVQRARDRLADRRLAGAGRPDQGQDRARLLVRLDARAPRGACARRCTRRCGP